MSPLPYKIATLLYAFDAEDRVLLLERAREPNRGLWSPPGGKLETATGESPHACAARVSRSGQSHAAMLPARSCARFQRPIPRAA